MKGIYGLLVAAALGAVGFMLNWSYLVAQSQAIEMVDFVIVKEGVRLEPGDVYRMDDLDRVSIPRNAVGNLHDFAFFWGEAELQIKDMPVTRLYDGQDPELVLRKDLRVPPAEPRKLNENERVVGVPVDTRSFVSDFFKAGDQVSFVVPKFMDITSPGTLDVEDAVGSETIGPFEIHAVGNRVASLEVSRGANQNANQQNVLNIVVRMDGDEPEPKAQKLISLLIHKGISRVMVMTHPRVEK